MKKSIAQSRQVLLCLVLILLGACDARSRIEACEDPESGALLCPCETDESCGLYLTCSEGVCIDPRTPPANPICYTPCRAGALIDGVYRECSQEGLMQGCVGNASCINGSCVADPDVAASSEIAGVKQAMTNEDSDEADDTTGSTDTSDQYRCVDDLDCPSHQTCIDGSCYSQCAGDSECPDELSCYRHVCRVPCSTTVEEKACPKNSFCNTRDGENGFCEQNAGDPSGEQRSVPGSFNLDKGAMALSNITDADSFVIRNDSQSPMEFVVRKIEHVEFTDEGSKPETNLPLFWLTISEGGIDECLALRADGKTPTDSGESDGDGREISVLVEGNGGERTVSLCGASNEELRLWNGTIEVGSEQLGYRTLNLTYTSEADGRWQGTIYYFANFGTDKLQEWIENKGTPQGADLLASVGNALIWRWDALRRGQISLDNFNAALQSAVTGSWSSATVKQRCAETAGACYPYNDADGLESFSNDLSQRPIPSGVAELPIVMNLAKSSDDPNRLIGRIDSGETLHYAGEPAVTIQMSLPANKCDEHFSEACINYVEDLDATIVVGGRYYPRQDQTSCTVEGFELVDVPWLVSGFTSGVRQDGPDGLYYRSECRATNQPYTTESKRGLNKFFAGSNPIPDGRSRIRSLHLIDGILINQEQMLLLFEERFIAGEDDDRPIVAHGVIRLGRTPATLAQADFVGSEPRVDDANERDLSPMVSCSDRIVKTTLSLQTLPEGWTPVPTTALDIDSLAHALVSGLAPGEERMTVEQAGETVHYLCHDNGLIDGGPGDNGEEGATSVECPAGSKVTYFAMASGWQCGDQAAIAAIDCQIDGSCERYVFTEMLSALGCRARLNPKWACRDDQRYCDSNRLDLRADKVFYADNETAVFLPLHNSVDDAFRYKTAFVSRKDRNLGFVPSECSSGDSSVPYCYDAAAIEEVIERVDCALNLFVNQYDSLSPLTQTELSQYLQLDFSIEKGESEKDGFEALLAELAVMLGDDAYTAAFASRFDLAATRTRSFEGELFEQDGINLSGVAGYEMHSLYRATQYYQLALDRFYSLMPLVRASLRAQREGNAAFGFITQETVTNYFDRLIRASSQKARAWSEIAKRYQSFNKPDLARSVVERAYTSTYLESVLITQLMHEVSDVVKSSEVAQIDLIIQQSLRLYKAALLDMGDVYASIRDEHTFFGYPADYIPFPALDPNDVNAFEKLLAAAWEATDFAREKEDRALEKARDFDVDEESFQAELIRIRNNYEGQLGEICGLFPLPPKGEQWLPAIAKYAHLWDEIAPLGDPCGAVGSGAIHEAMVARNLAILEVDQAILKRQNKQQEMDIETERIESHCASILEDIEATKAFARAKQAINTVIHAGDVALEIYDRFRSSAETSLKGTMCEPPTAGTAVSPGNCIQVALATTVKATSEGIYNAAKTIFDVGKFAAEEAIAWVEVEKEIAGLAGQCDLARIDSLAKIKTLNLEKNELEKEINLKIEAVALADSQLAALRNQAKRLQAEQIESEQLAINIEAARNDPNVRIYKNDAVISADRSFTRAVQAAYKATKVYEYYTSQSYARLENLFLIRMIQSGDFSLEEYLFELESNYTEFEESYGNPDTRVAIISLRDDIWGIPRIDGRGQSISENERLSLFRKRLADPRLLDARGHMTIAFSTQLEDLSPLTRNHKILYIEAEFVGTDVGDTLGRIYLRQRGTGTVRAVGGDKIYYALPDKTAVLNTFFNGERFSVFSDDAVLRNERFRDLPYANTAWELVINQRDEKVNQDINLQSLSDVRLYIYYTDFTEL